jgi:hypothetical protein
MADKKIIKLFNNIHNDVDQTKTVKLDNEFPLQLSLALYNRETKSWTYSIPSMNNNGIGNTVNYKNDVYGIEDRVGIKGCDYDYNDLVINMVIVPEPSILLLLSSMLMLALLRK